MYHGVSWFEFGARIKWKRVDRVDNWKKGRCHRQPFARVYRIRVIKGLFGPFAKNSAVTIAAFMSAFD